MSTSTPHQKKKVKYVDDINDITTQTNPTQYERVEFEEDSPDLWNNNIIWEFAKGLKPGVDLTRIPFPVCITQPRSFLQSFTDYFEHWEFISQAAKEDDPHKRMKLLTLWYVSGFAKAMKLTRKPYNPILGEVFRCMWENENGSRTYYIAEQVSHHPPITALHLCNREDGWSVSGTVKFGVSFYGLSAWAHLYGVQKVKLSKYDEEYLWTFPPTKASGFFVGPFMMEMGGVVTIKSEKNPYWTELDFKVQGMFSSANLHAVEGKICQNKKKPIDVIKGKYFKQVNINGEIFWDAENAPPAPQRYEVPAELLWGRESQSVWKDLTAAVKIGDGNIAADKKYEVEDWQRKERAENEKLGIIYTPHFFSKVDDNTYSYLHESTDPVNSDEEVVEIGGVITIKKK
ncbi:Oxysterol binding protein [Entamoeba marina]